ncbi:MAG TPA: hypothetical protein VHB21_14000, partial [Minicystis sp.]|nr:hypothetical protein [Minicystis sp.]
SCAAAPGCTPAGEACVDDPHCCGGSCKLAGDGLTRCQLAQGCRVDGEQCATDGDCCSGRCTVGADGLVRCTPLADCVMADGKHCGLQAGEVCTNDDACCTRACRPSSDGPKRCAYLGGCHQQCELCTSDAACCSGVCEQDAEGVRRCAPNGGSCNPTGDVCGGPSPACCGTGAKCKSPPMQPPPRCQPPPGDAGSLPDGAPCALASSCAGGFCVPASDGKLVCASDCRGERESCTARSDCCGPLEHDCVALDGPPACVPLIH